ncbi:DNA (Cytosine-5)-methyltransferase 1 [Coniochaeta hoffmannii]|uniref:DNA (cytosine-5-)-methyltransferase n=1 Tax=Coniochaeta hoffmannii TaxID=91930 RepID=A0AA38SLN2_9PEZI|nr:DNA (Cytosine-5)-methyltransferase 1 [Coniochaeta hoffmannii]
MPPWSSGYEESLDDDFQQPFLSDDWSGSVVGSVEAEAGRQEHSELPEHDEESPAFQSQRSAPCTPGADSVTPSDAGLMSDATPPVETRQPRQKFEVRLPKSTLATPRGRYEGWSPPAPEAGERRALASLLERLESQTEIADDDFTEFELDNFSVYVDSKLRPCELRPLQHVSTTARGDFYFDGVLRFGDLQFYVRRVSFSELPIGNYGPTHDSVGDQIWIRSGLNAKKEVYYKLKKPAAEYERFHTPFLWIANLAKHVVDYCGHLTEKKQAVTLRHFQCKFPEWLRKTHKRSPTLRQWHQAHGSDDFRTAITANIEFLWKEAYGVLGHRAAHSLQLFREVKHLTQYRPFTSVLGDKRNPVQPMTIVTPYVYKCFGHSEFGALLEPLSPTSEDVRNTIPRNKSGFDPHFKPDFQTAEEVEQEELDILEGVDTFNLPCIRRRKSTQLESSLGVARRRLVDSIKPGEVISTPPDGAGTGTKWKKESAKGATHDYRWFGLVQCVHVSPKTRARSFDVIWLYRPVDTPCGKMVYPWSKELFLSDHCTCEEGRAARVDEDEVLEGHSIDWFGSPETSTAEFFVRQTYQVEQRRWVTLERRHMTCDHDKLDRVGYKRGDTVLAACSGDRVDVYEVDKVFEQGNNRFARLRRLIRRTELRASKRNIRRNELVYTDQMVAMKPQHILGRCIVRFFDTKEPIPCPYDREGTANVFFITHKLENGACVPIADHNRPSTMRQGFDPKRRVEKLRGLDLFCGSGNFGRGLEEGGVVDMRWTNDIWTEAIHSYMVNARHSTKPFLGSVDDLLRCAINCDHDAPKRGEVDFISGGSPCQGFSLITSDKTNDRQKKNRSLVASFASFVDFYRPKYGILENVLNIVQTGRNRDEDAFSQLICAIVGMGYQTQLTLGDAWTYGAPQSRSRAFLYFGAPGYRLPDPPRPSHSHFDGVKSRGLGVMSNGESFVRRSFEPTPFKFVSAAEAAADLPEIHDALPDYCVGFPDHRISMGVTTKSRHQYHRIPIQPYGMNFVKTWKEGKGIMTPAERELFPDTGLRVQKISQGWGRVKPNSVFHTVTTCITPTDARTGRFLHWHEDRPITILEARRAQGFLDNEVLIGNPMAQYELVGNSVARPMALALGLQFREAWLGSLHDDRVPVSVDERGVADADLAEMPMAMTDEDTLEQAAHDEEWVDDGDSLFVGNTPERERRVPNDVEVGVGRMDTPSTSVSESDAIDLLPTWKRPLSELSAVELHISKVRRVEASDEHPLDSGVTGKSTDAAMNGDAIEHLSAASAAVVVEGERIDVLAINGEFGLNAAATAPSPTNGSVVVRSVVDLTVSNEGPAAGVARTVIESSSSMVVDLTEG